MTTKQIVSFQISPGLYTEQTERGAVGYWYEADKVRFRRGLAEKLGGWTRLSPQFLGTCRRIRDWTSLDAKQWSAIGTDTKLYLWQNGTLYDITPIRASGTLTNPFTTTNTSAVVSVAHTSHGAQAGDYVRYSGATAVGGITIDGEYQIAAITDIDNYTITHSSAATSGASGGGTVSYEYDISAGASSVTTATGYGSGPYGAEFYGNARTGSTLQLPIRTWSLDTWGEDLIASPRGGAIYWWDRSKGTGSRASLLVNAPTSNQYVLVSTRDRHLLALGAYDDTNDAFDPMLIRWCSTEDLNDWVATSTNSAGELRLFSGSKIVCGIRSRLETLVFTDTSVHTLPFVGGDDVFGLNIVGENVSVLGPNCVVAVDHRVFLMAEADFYIYDGIIQVLPCTVRNFVYDNLNVTQSDKIYGGLNREFNEIWWFYPSFDPEAYVQQDFGLGLPSADLPSGYRISDGQGTLEYNYQFNSGGWTEPYTTASGTKMYEADYFLTNDEIIPDPTEAEYAVEFAFHPDGAAATRWVGMVLLREEIYGTPDAIDDDAKAIYVEADYFTDAIRVVRKTATGVKSAMDNAGADATFLGVSGTAAARGQKYILTARVSNDQITVWLDGVQALQIAFSPPEIATYTSGSAGLHAAIAADLDSEVKFYNFAVGPVGVLTDADFDISPIEVNRYVVFNYEEGTWVTGTMSRTAWADRSPVLEKPYAAGADGYLYQHETGTDASGVAMEAFIQSYDMEIPTAGEELMHVDQLIPDFMTLDGSVDVYLTGKKYPQSATRISKGPYTVTASTTKISTRMRARQVALRVESDANGDRWRMGTWRARIGAHGKR